MVADSEVICVLGEILRDLQLGTFEIKINHRGLLDAMLQVRALSVHACMCALGGGDLLALHFISYCPCTSSPAAPAHHTHMRLSPPPPPNRPPNHCTPFQLCRLTSWPASISGVPLHKPIQQTHTVPPPPLTPRHS